MNRTILILLVVMPTLSFAKDSQWLSFDKGLDHAKQSNKPVLIDFYTDWCHWCKVMDEKTFQNKDVEKRLTAEFVTIRINAEDQNSTVQFQGKSYTHPELTQYFGVRGFPTLAFLNSESEIITLIPGYVPAETFVHVLDYIRLKCYEKQMSFEDFVKSGGCKNEKKEK